MCRFHLFQDIIYLFTLVGEAYSRFYNYNEDLPTIVSNVNCIGTEQKLIDCPYTIGNFTVTTRNLATLQCSSDCMYVPKLVISSHFVSESRK